MPDETRPEQRYPCVHGTRYCGCSHDLAKAIRERDEARAALVAAEERGRQQMIAALRDGEGMAPFVDHHRERERQQPSPLRFAPTREVLADYLGYVAKEMGTQ